MKRTGRLREILFLGMLLCGLAAGVAEAGKPGSEAQLLAGSGGYAETPLFDSAEVLVTVQGESALNPITGAVSMSNAEDLRLTYGLEVDDAGAVYAMFQADGTVTGGTNIYTGVVRYDDTNGLEVVLARAVYYEGIGSESNHGDFLWRQGMDRVPTLAPSATGDLRSGDFVISRTYVGTEVADNRNEIVLFQADASGQLVEERVLCAFDVGTNEHGIQVAADCFGNVYVWLFPAATGDAYASGVYRLSYDGATGDYGLARLSFPFETNQYFDTDGAGNLYVQNAFSADGRVVYRLQAGDDPQYDAARFATYSDTWGTWTADNAAANGALAMFLNRGSRQLNFIGLASQGSEVAYTARIAESGSNVYGMTADAEGSLYVAHEDRAFVSKNQSIVTAYTVYRLDPTTSDGGDTGGGKGNGKGKNK